MEHNGTLEIGEWHVVTQPHFNCPRGSFRPAVFCPDCDASTCACECHIPGCDVDPATCGCKGKWRRASANEWVKTTSAPTANNWRDRRARTLADMQAEAQKKAFAEVLMNPSATIAGSAHRTT
eukprot:2771483-Prymnesium_polylepis.1